MLQIDYFFFPLSTFTYLAGNRLEEIAARHGAAITYKPFDLSNVFRRTGGTPLPERHDSRKTYRLQDMARISKRTGLPLTIQPRHWPTNPAPAAYAIIAAQNAGGGDVGALVQAILRACFAEEKDIAEDQVLRDCLVASGFDAGLTDSGLIVGAETYGANTEEAVSRGVFGAPFYIVGEERFWGQDRLSYLSDYLAGVG